jgi:hypothetical protein
MHGIWSDIQLSFRLLRKSAGFSAAALLSLAVAIGANAAIFSAANGMLFRPLPYPGADRLVMFRSAKALQPNRSCASNVRHQELGNEIDKVEG